MERRLPIRPLAVLALVLASLLALPAFAAPPGRGGDRLERRIERLELDASARQQVDAILDEARTERRGLRRAIRTEREALRERLAAPEADEASLLASSDRVHEAERALKRHEIAVHLELRAVLSAEQIAAVYTRPRSRGFGAGR